MRTANSLQGLQPAFTALVLLAASSHQAWNKGPSGNATTNQASECANPPYATHDWIPTLLIDTAQASVVTIF